MEQARRNETYSAAQNRATGIGEHLHAFGFRVARKLGFRIGRRELRLFWLWRKPRPRRLRYGIAGRIPEPKINRTSRNFQCGTFEYGDASIGTPTIQPFRYLPPEMAAICVRPHTGN
jgi:hypothetical protein